MIKEIKYNGHSASPSDYQSPDGDMASMLNCIPERGALKPILPPETVKSFGKGTTVLAIHKVANREHYILYAGTVLTWEMVGGDATDELYDFSDDGGVASVTPIGNTLAVLDGNGTIHYFLWRNDAYSNLGTRLPELEAKPYISTHIYDSTEIDAQFGIEFTEDKPSLVLSGSDGLLNQTETKKLYNAQTSSLALYGNVRQNVYERIFATLNQTERLLKQKGFFTAPFFVRFAYRLYDNSYAMHTVPVLMVPTTWGAPLTTVRINSDGRVTFDPLFSASQLTAIIDFPEDFSNWEDIIVGVDIFVTPQAISYTDSPDALVSLSQLPFCNYGTHIDATTGEEVKAWVTGPGGPRLMDNDGYWRDIYESFSAQVGNEAVFLGSFSVKQGRTYTINKGGARSLYLAVDVSQGPVKLFNSSGVELQKLTNHPTLPTPEGGNYDIYIYTSGYLKIKGPDTTIRKYGYGPSGTTFADNAHHYIALRRTDGKDFQEVVTDYNTFYKIAELDIKSYGSGFSGTIPLKKNALENLSVRQTLPDTGQGRSLNEVSHCFSYNNRLNIIVDAEYLPSCSGLLVQNPALGNEQRNSIVASYVKVIENSQTSYYQLDTEQLLSLSLVYFAYPRATAKELILYFVGDNDQTYISTIPLEPHPFLNLAYAFNAFDAISYEQTETQGLGQHPQTPIFYGNKIKTSSVNNPFIFSEENTSELPVGEIYALSTAAKALSQGQFGQFPLYAFTDKGVWALEVTGTGTYSTRQTITRDVVEPPKSVTQIDDVVLFATERGIMLLSGSQVQCISEVLDGTEFDITQLEFAYKKISEDSENSKALNTVSWDTYKANIQMLYDYTGQRIIVFNPEYDHAYVFSLESKQWGIMESNIKSTVNYYPRAYAMTDAGNLVDYSAADKDFAKGYYITRPLKLDAPDVHKTITGIIQRGQFKKGHVNTMLYGSRDLENWYPVYGSNDHILRGMRGTPYKYFRIASTFHLECDESITGCSVDFEPRLNNKLR